MTTTHRWTFFRAGGVEQVVFRRGEDIARLAELDQKLWAALACPTRGLEFDPRTLDLIDADHDGRIRAPELIAAAEWACARLTDAELLMRGDGVLPLEAIATGDDEGRALAAEAREVLALVGRPGEATIALDDVLDRGKLLDAMRFDGDGLVTPAAAGEDAATAAVIDEIGRTQGTQPDRRGHDGIDRARAEAFFAQVDALDAWQREGMADPACAPLGDATPAAVAAFDAVRAKVDDYFARCRIAAFDPGALAPMNAGEEQFKALAAQPLALDAAPLADLPLARIAPGRPLPLADGLNPFWAAAVAALRVQVIEPLLGTPADGATAATPAAPPAASLDEAQWATIQARLAPARAWLAARPAGPIDALAPGAERIAALAAPPVRAAVMALFDAEDAARAQQERFAELEKLLRLQRDLLRLLNNFVSFADFYRRRGAIFQAGRLYLDARSCDLSVKVGDPARHAALAGMAKAYLAYCECRRGAEKMHIVSAFTAGDVDFLFVGRNGLFYDRDGRDWDATITKVIENPTSIGQAFFSPYKKFLRLLEEQVAKRAAAGEATAQGSLGGLATRMATAGPAAPGAAAPVAPAAAAAAAAGATAAAGAAAARPRFDVGTIAALGVALGSLSAVAVGIFTKFVDLGWWIPVAVLGIVLAISGPSMLIAWLKLRQRSLGPILDASGWAINGRLRVNIGLGGSLSQSAQVPLDADRQLRDPFAPRRGPALAVALVAALLVLLGLAWRFAWLDPLLPGGWQRGPALAKAASAQAAASAASAAATQAGASAAGAAAPAGVPSTASAVAPAPSASAVAPAPTASAVAPVPAGSAVAPPPAASPAPAGGAASTP